MTPGSPDLLAILAEVRGRRAEQPGRREWYDAQERCLVELVRRLEAGGGDGSAAAGHIRAAVARMIEEMVAGTAVGEEVKRRLALARWRAGAHIPRAVQVSLWESETAAARGESLPAAGERSPRVAPAGDSQPVSTPSLVGSDAGAPRLLAAVGETADAVMDDAACLGWLREIAAGRPQVRVCTTGSASDEWTPLRARLSLLLELWHGV